MNYNSKIIYEFRSYRSDSKDTPEVIVRSVDGDLEDLCVKFEAFLRACTYHIDGSIQLVEDSKPEPTLEELKKQRRELTRQINFLKQEQK